MENMNARHTPCETAHTFSAINLHDTMVVAKSSRGRILWTAQMTCVRWYGYGGRFRQLERVVVIYCLYVGPVTSRNSHPRARVVWTEGI